MEEATSHRIGGLLEKEEMRNLRESSGESGMNKQSCIWEPVSLKWGFSPEPYNTENDLSDYLLNSSKSVVIDRKWFNGLWESFSKKKNKKTILQTSNAAIEKDEVGLYITWKHIHDLLGNMKGNVLNS